MQHAGRIVENPPDAMAAEIADDGEPLALRQLLDGMADVNQLHARAHDLDSRHHGAVCRIHQALGLHAGLAHIEHTAGIAMPAVEDDRHIDIEDVTVHQLALPRNAVTDHVID